jgi:hypothetical protein
LADNPQQSHPAFGKETLMAEHSMEFHSTLEVHFHDQDSVSCFFESTATGSKQQFGEILHFCAFSARQLQNIGNHPEADQAAYMLRELDGEPERLGVLANSGRSGDLELAEYAGSQGRKRFETRLDTTDQKFRFKLKAKGFGFRATGMGYYVPSSITALLMYFGKRNQNDAGYLAGLAQAASLLGQLQLEGSLSGRSQINLALFCTATGAGETNEWMQSLD